MLQGWAQGIFGGAAVVDPPLDNVVSPRTHGLSQNRNAKEILKQKQAGKMAAVNAARAAPASDGEVDSDSDMDTDEPETGGGGAAAAPERDVASGSGGGIRAEVVSAVPSSGATRSSSAAAVMASPRSPSTRSRKPIDRLGSAPSPAPPSPGKRKRDEQDDTSANESEPRGMRLIDMQMLAIFIARGPTRRTF
jgi:hypothetical protein